VAVRYADDAVLGFQYREEAERFLVDLRERLQQFGLELHPEKTRLIEFGRYAAERRAKRGEGKPETFNVLGFTHICGKNHRNTQPSGPISKVRTVCVSSASTGLCGGQRATAVPTATATILPDPTARSVETPGELEPRRHERVGNSGTVGPVRKE
jgi:Reverse transcriptase (RNA-dependent DNA polymerase)